MRLRTKLIAYFLIIACLVPLLGGAAVERIRSIDKSVQDLSDTAIPRLQLAERLSEIQRDQQAAALAFQANGRPEDRQRYLDLSAEFDTQLAKLKEVDQSDRGKELLATITTERAKFLQAGTQLVSSRQTVTNNIENLRAQHDKIVLALNSIRRRFVPAGGANAGSDIGTIPVSLRNQVNDLLLGTEAMLHMVANEFQLATTYILAPTDQTKQEFDTAGGLFASSFQVAYNAGGPEDRNILNTVQQVFSQFESSARAMITAGDVSGRARIVFPEASNAIGGTLTSYVQWQSDQMGSARASSTSAVSSGQNLVLVFTLIAFVLAGGLGFWFARSITRPIVRLRNIADRVSTGDLEDVEIEVSSTDEVADLANSFRRMVASVRFLMMREQEDEPAEIQYPAA